MANIDGPLDGGRRLLLISNRLPFSLAVANSRVTYTQSIGGVAIGLGAVSRHFHALWIGALNLPGEKIEGQLGNIEEHLARHNCLPVVLSAEEIDGFYTGLSNSLLWPLFHGLPTPADFSGAWWEKYIQVNEKFFEKILAVVRPGDILWVNDYHLLLLPSMLRRALANHRIGFFLHIPFPEPSIFDRLPFRDEILDGISGSDQIGVNTAKYRNRLLVCMEAHSPGRNAVHGLAGTKRLTESVSVFPLGIDVPRIRALLANAEVQILASALRTRFAEKKVILSADRLDYTKGIPQKLRAYEILLETYPVFREKVQLVLIVAPSRMTIFAYAQLGKEISSLVESINAKYAAASWKPIHFVNRVVSYGEMLAYLKVADIAVITPLEDAMNLVAKEYLYVKGGEAGALVLSRNAGAAIELKGAYQVDPMNEKEIAKAMREALLADSTEIVRRNLPMVSRIRRYTAVEWAHDFLRSLGEQEVI